MLKQSDCLLDQQQPLVPLKLLVLPKILNSAAASGGALNGGDGVDADGQDTDLKVTMGQLLHLKLQLNSVLPFRVVLTLIASIFYGWRR